MAKKKQTLAEEAAKELCNEVAKAMLDKKAQNVVSLDLSAIDGAICSHFVVCNAESTTQVDAIARNIEDHVRKTLGQKPRRVEGADNSLWILLDYVDVMAHVFQTETRDFYRIEQLWADALREEHTDEPPVKVKKAAAVKKPAAKATAVKKTAAAKTATATKKVAAAPAKKAASTVKKAATTKKVAEKTPVKKAATAKKVAEKVTEKVAVKKASPAKKTTVKKATAK
jgi:ribosome-associated protein